MATGDDDDRVTQLARAAGRGDQGALTEFIRATQRDVWRMVAYLDGPGSADDLTQETFLRAIGSLPRFSGRSTARTWLLSIARRVVVDQIRYNTRRPRTAYVADFEDAVNRGRRGSRREDRAPPGAGGGKTLHLLLGGSAEKKAAGEAQGAEGPRDHGVGAASRHATRGLGGRSHLWGALKSVRA